ncbi:hypothetical protein G4B88_031266 [Cannabis sativa]|uniref:Uncharacterized protein n=1 Tax=Cannabis sativa TaxID=3483 RepID=A0A7J6E595_CANSA|nr:hypothetical protein G4B88_031266 [Cannabis sativa]
MVLVTPIALEVAQLAGLRVAEAVGGEVEIIGLEFGFDFLYRFGKMFVHFSHEVFLLLGKRAWAVEFTGWTNWLAAESIIHRKMTRGERIRSSPLSSNKPDEQSLTQHGFHHFLPNMTSQQIESLNNCGHVHAVIPNHDWPYCSLHGDGVAHHGACGRSSRSSFHNKSLN